MPKTLALIHTIAGLVNVFDDLCHELLVDVEKINIVDEAVLKMLLEAGGLTPAAYRRINDDIVFAETAGADVILLTCSSISPCVDIAQKLVSVPLLKIDEPMVDKAISLGSRIGVVATAPTTLKPTAELLHIRSQKAGKQTHVAPVLCEGAFESMRSGNMQKHDRIVTEYLHRMMQENDVIVLAQASMARVVDTIPDADKRVPILSSPRLGIERVGKVISSLK